MANIKISELPVATTVNDLDVVVINQSGVTKQAARSLVNAPSGTLPVANGGTGVTVSTGANSVVLRDANQNIAVNSTIEGFTSVAASGVQIVLTVASTPSYLVTGSGGQVIKLPDATTLQNGVIYLFNNNQSSGAISVNNNSNTLVASIPSGGFTAVSLLSNATAAGSWERHEQAPSNVTWSTNTLDYAGSITSATWNANAVAINRGGTGAATQQAAINALAGATTSAQFLRGNGTNVVMSAIQASDVPTLNQNTTGTASNVTGTVAIVNGGTGQTTQQAAINALAGAVTSAQFLRGNGTNITMSAIQASDVPALNQNTTGTAANVTGTVALVNGGTGATTQQGALNAIAGATTSAQFLRGNGTNVSMSAIQAGDVPILNQNTTGTAANVTGTVAVANGGSGQTSYTDGQLLIGNSTGNTLSKATLTAGANVTITNAPGAITIAAAGGSSTPTDVQIFTSSGTWTKPAGAVAVDVVVISAGGGGGSGRKAGVAAQASGGGGGGGGSYSMRNISAALLGATEAVTVGIGGTGGASVTANSTNGNIGVTGGNSSFGAWIQVTGGGGAGAATNASGPAGAGSSSRAMFQGGNGSAGGAGAGTLTAGSNANVSGAGGGAGGGLPAAATVGFTGSAGGTALGSWFSGGTATGGTIGGNGGSAPSVTVGFAASGSAGAGGGSSVTGNAGNGGNGGTYGGAGGGGGAGLDSVGNSGAGGNGADGIVVVTTYF